MKNKCGYSVVQHIVFISQSKFPFMTTFIFQLLGFCYSIYVLYKLCIIFDGHVCADHCLSTTVSVHSNKLICQ